MAHFPLTQGLHDTIIASSCLYTNIQVLPAITSVESVEDLDNDTLEIGVLKKAVLAIFTEGHSFFDGKYPKIENIQFLSQEQLKDNYFACLALLATTNDFTTIWRLHEQLVWELTRKYGVIWLRNDFTFCVALAMSRLSKVNKSPLLWHWLRKLFAYNLSQRIETLKLYKVLRQTLRSMESHLANYAAGYTLEWFIKVAGLLRTDFDELTALSLVREKCRLKLGDNSLWTAFCNLLSAETSAYDVAQYSRIIGKLEKEGLIDKKNELIREVKSKYFFFDHSTACDNSDTKDTTRIALLQQQAREELQWLLGVQCMLELRYRQVVQIFQETEVAIEMIRQKIEQGKVLLASRELDSVLQDFVAEVPSIPRTRT